MAFEGLEALVDVDLRNFEIRYAEGGAACLPRPVAPVDDSEITGNADLAEWSQCNDNLVEAQRVCSTCTNPDFPPALGCLCERGRCPLPWAHRAEAEKHQPKRAPLDGAACCGVCLPSIRQVPCRLAVRDRRC